MKTHPALAEIALDDGEFDLGAVSDVRNPLTEKAARGGEIFVYPNLEPVWNERSVSCVRGVGRWAKSHPNARGAP